MVPAPHCTGCTGELDPIEAAKAYRGRALLSWPTGLYADSMTTPESPLPTRSFIADEDKEFQASLTRDRAEITLWDQIHFFGRSPISSGGVSQY
jgi:hypothetical protein